MANGVTKGMGKLFSALLIIVATTALAPVIFENIASLSGSESDVPTWVSALIGLVAGIGVVMIIYNSTM